MQKKKSRITLTILFFIATYLTCQFYRHPLWINETLICARCGLIKRKTSILGILCKEENDSNYQINYQIDHCRTNNHRFHFLASHEKFLTRKSRLIRNGFNFKLIQQKLLRSKLSSKQLDYILCFLYHVKNRSIRELAFDLILELVSKQKTAVSLNNEFDKLSKLIFVDILSEPVPEEVITKNTISLWHN